MAAFIDFRCVLQHQLDFQDTFANKSSSFQTLLRFAKKYSLTSQNFITFFAIKCYGKVLVMFYVTLVEQGLSNGTVLPKNTH